MLRHMQCSAYLSNNCRPLSASGAKKQTSVATCNLQGALYVLSKGEERSLRIELCRVRRSERAHPRPRYNSSAPAAMWVSLH